MIETVFYLQVLIFFILLLFGIVYRGWPFFLLAAVISISLGATLAAGEPVEFYTGAFTLTENADANTWIQSPDLNALTISNSPPVNTWHYLLLYGGFVWIIIAFLLIFRSDALNALLSGGSRET